MNLLFCCYDFKKENLRLMPRRYIYEVARGLAKKGHQVHAISIERSGSSTSYDVEGVTVCSLNKKELFSDPVFKKLTIKAEIIIWSASSLTAFLYPELKRLGRKLLLLFTGPFYSLKEVIQAQKSKVPFGQLATHYKQSLAPLRLTASLANSALVRKIIVLSRKNADILKKYGGHKEKLVVIPPGYDGPRMMQPQVLPQVDARQNLLLPSGKKILTYLGSLYQVRGVRLLLDAFVEASNMVPDLLLLILARTENQIELVTLTKRATKLGLTYGRLSEGS